MAIIDQLSQEEIEKEFSHVGVLLGCVPVYIQLDTEDGYPVLQEVNWVPMIWFSLVVFMYQCFVGMADWCAGDEVDVGFPFIIYGHTGGECWEKYKAAHNLPEGKLLAPEHEEDHL